METVHPWVLSLFEIYRLKVAGYPFDKNDLDLETWQALFIVCQETENFKWTDREE